MDNLPTPQPDWDQLFELASAQEGYFTTPQAAEAGYSSQLLAHHLHAGKIIRIRRGIYRLVHYPAGDHEELTIVWLWSEQEGVFSHQTALWLHNLSDLMPNKLHLTLPADWKARRLRVPEGVVLHYSDISKSETQWFGSVQITSPIRTLRDCASVNISPEHLRDAAQDALSRGLVRRDELRGIEEVLQPFGGLAR